MTKQQFIKYMSLIQNFHSEQQTLQTLIDKISDGYSVVTMGDYLVNGMIDLITEILGCEDKGLLSWWLYEDVEKIIYDNGKPISVKNLEELYEYIIKNKNA